MRNFSFDQARRNTYETNVLDFYRTYTAGWQRLAGDDIKVIVKTLKRRKVLGVKQWIPLPKNKPKSVLENVHYSALERIFAIVLEAAEENGLFSKEQRTTTFECRPDHTICSEARGGSFRVDAYGRLLESTFPAKARKMRLPRSAHLRPGSYRSGGPPIYTCDLALTAKFMPVNVRRMVCEDERQMLGGSGHIMFNDPCRTRHFSLTIEGNMARLWIHTRSHSAVTYAFDIQSKPQELIQFFLFIGYASKEQLGFDPSVRRVYNSSGGLQYQYKVTDREGVDRYYETISIIYQKSATRLHSRGMRVLEVREVTKDGRDAADQYSRVLRDFWAYEDARPETEILGDIISRLKEEESELVQGDDLGDIEQHFMEFICDVCVGEPAPAPPPKSRVYQFPEDDANVDGKESSSAMVKSHLQNTVVGLDPTPHGTGMELPSALHARKHCRTVHMHLCQDLYKISDPAEFFFALGQCIAILKRFRRIGYLHRDVSPGNFLLYCLPQSCGNPPPDGDLAKKFMVKVSDLEYSKPYSVVSQHDPLTGTAYYTAVEVQHRMHLFHYSADFDESKKHLATLFFAFNFYHDVESVLWMAIDFILRRFPDTTTKTYRTRCEIAEKLSAYAARVFRPEMRPVDAREALIWGRDSIIDLSALLTQAYGKDSIVAQGIKSIVIALSQAYQQVESVQVRLEDVPTARLRFEASAFTDTIYDVMYRGFRDISLHFQQPSVKFLLTKDFVEATKAGMARKRARRDDDVQGKGSASKAVGSLPRLRQRTRQATRDCT
ncbi:uncharacterized protein SCHCODRAFT_02564734 [Schizophyllum commune H4-8]|uniref:uncharacterized protein n=1 Tax=Schizophyllum commune (strain H4-8 / FGSC 9210) TaxID=578458 RepID=UPI00216050B9|nr:uncharacterized protein SCHCODRAFT_02564734 [Schizophyllum commune H4-8]KAI5897674.1 hypothetical protein SCHCODRAFT_02564734 [Schizophyllum commune H4-8]